MKKLIALLLLLFFITLCKAQNLVNSMKDRDGNIWFTVSERGVYRYDGTSFTNFTRESYGLNIKVNECLYQDQTGNLWFNTDRGLCYYNGKKFIDFQLPTLPENVVASGNYELLYRTPIKVGKMLQDRSGSIWFLTADHGVYRYNTNPNGVGIQEKSLPPSQSAFTNFIFDSAPNCILETKKGEILIGSWAGGSVYRYNEKPENSDKPEFTKLAGFSDGMISFIKEDQTGTIWVGTRNAGVDRYDPSTSEGPNKKTITNFSEKDGLLTTCVYCFLEDSKGKIWLGTDAKLKSKRGDVFYYDPSLGSNGKSLTNITANASQTLTEGFVFNVKSLAEDKSGKIWIGSIGGFLLCYDPAAADKPGTKPFTDFSEKIAK